MVGLTVELANAGDLHEHALHEVKRRFRLQVVDLLILVVGIGIGHHVEFVDLLNIIQR